MGKRVFVQHLTFDPFRPHTTHRALLSCGHSSGPLSPFSFQGDPHWCERCADAPCLGCGAPSVGCCRNSIEWGEACASCLALTNAEWCARVAARRAGCANGADHDPPIIPAEWNLEDPIFCADCYDSASREGLCL